MQTDQQSGRFKRRSVTIEELRVKQRRRRFRQRVFYLALFLGLSLIFLAVCFVVFFRIKTVRIEGESRYSDEEILEVLDIETGSNLYSFSLGDKARRLEKSLPYIYETVIERELPSGIVVHVKEKTPGMYLELRGDTYLLTDAMQVLEYTSDTAKLYGLLKVHMRPETISRCIVGERLLFTDARTGGVIAAIYAAIEEAELGHRIGYIDANNRFGIYLEMDGKYRVYIGDVENFDAKLAFAKGIADKLAMVYGGDESGSIDVSQTAKGKGVFKPD